MKKFLLAASLIILVFTIKSQTISFTGGDKVFGLGVGYETYLYTGGEWSMDLPPVALSFDYCIIDSIGKMKQAVGVGAIVNYSKATIGIKGNTQGIHYDILNIGLRGTYHIYTKKKYDLYAGIMAWYVKPIGSIFNTSNSDTPFIDKLDENKGFNISAFLGLRYYLNKQISLFGELEYKVTWVTVGVSVRFR